MRFLAALLAASVVAFAASAQDASLPPPQMKREAVSGVLERAVDGFIRPGYVRFEESAGALEAAMKELCATPSIQTLEAARTAFSSTVAAWSKIEVVRIGPVIEGNRFERILFYPDRKSTGLKQVQALLAKPDESAATADTLRDKSVAMQGLGALEFVLYGTGGDILATDEQGFRCRYGAAIAGNLQNLGQELSAAWEDPAGIQTAWKHPGPDNPVFRTEEEAVTALLGILVHGAEAIRDQRIETFYKGADSRATPRQAIFWRSGQTWNSVVANLNGLKDLLDTSDMRQLLDPAVQSIVSSIDFVLKSLIRTASTVDKDLEVAVERADERAKLDFLLLNSRDLIVRLNDSLGGALGLGAGFSFSDGD